ncbi:uncharacterized protein LOC132386259, partial [Hypanus sabinus]|uniref:uncharacterized protein LOC132386259 n=1 Tax=Hypanus sabinus TaxID=79690 RepID=UPI0028C4051A
TQRILDRSDDNETYMNVKFTKTDFETPSRGKSGTNTLRERFAEPDVSYAEVKLKTPSAPRVRKDRDGQNTTYSELNVRKKKPRIDKDEHSPISSGPGGRSTAARTAEPVVSYAEVNFKTPSAPRVRTDREGLKSTYSELNVRKKKPRVDEVEDPPISSGPGELSTAAQTAAQEQESKVKIGNRPYRLICLLCLVTSALIVIVAGLSIHGMLSDLRHQFTEMETKYRSVNETKAQICEFLTGRRGTQRILGRMDDSEIYVNVKFTKNGLTDSFSSSVASFLEEDDVMGTLYSKCGFTDVLYNSNMTTLLLDSLPCRMKGGATERRMKVRINSSRMRHQK